MITDRYYYNRLTAREKEIYKALYKGVLSLEEKILMPFIDISNDEFNNVFVGLTLDNPVMYYFNHSMIKIVTDNVGAIYLIPQYLYKADKIKKYNEKVQKTINELIVKLKLDEGTDYDKILKLHDYMCKNVTYDFEGDDLKNPLRVINSHNIIGVLANKSAQCEGIAMAVKLILNAVDVHCLVADGTAKSKVFGDRLHAWNLVNIDEDAYHLDVTWDIGNSIDKNLICHEYFNLNDELIGKDHFPLVNLPACSSQNLNYFTANNVVFDKKKSLQKYVIDSVNNDVKDIYFRYQSKTSIAKLMPELITLTGDTYSEKFQKDCIMETYSNEMLNVGRIMIK